MISGSNINILALNKESESLILSWVNNPELKRNIGTIYPISEFEHEVWFRNRAMDSINKTYIIWHKSDKKIIGIVGNKNTDFINRNTEIFLYVGEEAYRGKGLGKEVVELFTEFLFKQLNMHKVYLRVFSYNIQALKCYKKLNFEVEGNFKEAIFKDGKYYDVIILAKLNNL